MSKHNNANWDHYKVAGREHPGDEVHHDQERQQFSGSKAHAEQADQAGPHIPEPGASLAAARWTRRRQKGSGRRGGADAQNISGTDDVEPTLSDDEGYTGLATRAGRFAEAMRRRLACACVRSDGSQPCEKRTLHRRRLAVE